MRRPSEDDERRFWTKVALPDENGCMLWLARINEKGYGLFWLYWGLRRAHRVSYVLAYGPIPEGMEIDHVRAKGCRHRSCVAPEHLEAVTHVENCRRADMRTNSANRRKTHCPQSHPYDEANTYVDPAGGRQCRTCRNRRKRAA